MSFLHDIPDTLCILTVRLSATQWRTEGGGGGGGFGGSNPLPPNSEGPPKSCQTQPDCENC